MDENWNTLLSDFRKLGGIIENVCQQEGEFGRGIFAIDPAVKSRIYTPSELMIKKDDIYLELGLNINKESDTKSIITSYVNNIITQTVNNINKTKYITVAKEAAKTGLEKLEKNQHKAKILKIGNEISQAKEEMLRQKELNERINMNKSDKRDLDLISYYENEMYIIDDPIVNIDYNEESIEEFNEELNEELNEEPIEELNEELK